MSETEPQPTTPVVLFDGVCNLCNGAIQFILDHERARELRFAPLQSEVGRTLLDRAFARERALALRGIDKDPDSIVLLEGGVGYEGSSAALRIARHLRAPYRWLFAFIVVPRPLRDVVYRWIARHRYRWFGRTETCRIPTPELRARFLTTGSP